MDNGEGRRFYRFQTYGDIIFVVDFITLVNKMKVQYY